MRRVEEGGEEERQEKKKDEFVRGTALTAYFGIYISAQI